MVTRTWRGGHHRAAETRPSAAEVPDRGGAVGPDDEAVTVELAVCDPELVQAAPPARSPRTSSSSTRGVDRTQRASGDLGDQHGVAWVAIPAATMGRTDIPPRSAIKVTNASCYLPQTTEPEARSFAPVPEGTPDGREELAVPRIPPVHLDEQHLPVGGLRLDERDPARFERCVPKVGRLDTQIVQGRRDLMERRDDPPASRGSGA